MKALFVFIALALCLPLSAQDLLDQLNEEQSSKPAPVIQTFKGSHIVNGHSVETKGAKSLEFLIQHRFGALDDTENLFGLDYAYIRLGLEYGLTDNLSIGIGRSSWDKSLDAYLKYKVLQQTDQGMPFTMTVFGSTYYMSSKIGSNADLKAQDRTSYAAQIMLARKFSDIFSLQVSPIFLHRNTVDESIAVNDLFALGLGARIKLTRSLSLNLEYYPRLNEDPDSPAEDAYGVALDIETGGHVFQLVFTNSVGSMERIMLTESDDKVHFGFNITRTFQFGKKKKEAGW